MDKPDQNISAKIGEDFTQPANLITVAIAFISQGNNIQYLFLKCQNILEILSRKTGTGGVVLYVGSDILDILRLGA